MYASLLDESRLVDGHDVGQARREAVGHELGEDLRKAVDETNGPEVPIGGRISFLRHKNNVCRIDEAGHVPARIRQGVDGQPEVVLGDLPADAEEPADEAIWTRRFLSREVENSRFNLVQSEGGVEGLKVMWDVEGLIAVRY